MLLFSKKKAFYKFVYKIFINLLSKFVNRLYIVMYHEPNDVNQLMDITSHNFFLTASR